MPVKRYRKLPVSISAVQWNGSMADIIELTGQQLPTYGFGGQSGSLRITTLEGDMELRLGDYLIEGVKGEIYPCKPEIFAMTYEEVL